MGGGLTDKENSAANVHRTRGFAQASTAPTAHLILPH